MSKTLRRAVLAAATVGSLAAAGSASAMVIYPGPAGLPVGTESTGIPLRFLAAADQTYARTPVLGVGNYLVQFSANATSHGNGNGRVVCNARVAAVNLTTAIAQVGNAAGVQRQESMAAMTLVHLGRRVPVALRCHLEGGAGQVSISSAHLIAINLGTIRESPYTFVPGH